MSRYDPQKHHRRSLRMKDFDYCQPGAYFVTVSAKNQALLFGEIVAGRVEMNVYGRIVDTFWRRLPEHFPYLAVEEPMVMPNHFHGILWITLLDESTGERKKKFASMRRSQGDHASVAPKEHPSGAAPGSLGAIIANFKITTARRINSIRNSHGASVWHRNFHDVIIRNPSHLEAIRHYIRNNPRQWHLDPDKPSR